VSALANLFANSYISLCLELNGAVHFCRIHALIVVLKVQKQVTFFTISRCVIFLEAVCYLACLHVETDCFDSLNLVSALGKTSDSPPAASWQCCL